jgi:hypothetical protein
MFKGFISLALLAASACGSSAQDAAPDDGAVEEARLAAKAKATLLNELGNPGAVRFRNLKVLPPISACGEYSATGGAAPTAGFDKFRYAADTVMRYSDHARHHDLLIKSGYSEEEFRKLVAAFDKAWDECQQNGRPVQ